jgi:hypothetical protein
MILFMNVGICDPSYTKYNRGNSPEADKVDILKYTLSSYAAIPWSKIILYIFLDTNYEHRWPELERFIEENFNGKAILTKNRNLSQSEWQNADKQIDEDIIFFTCNHDHVFIDYNLNTINNSVKCLEEHREEKASVFISHFTEALEMARVGRREDNCTPNVMEKYEHTGYICRRGRLDSIQIITHEIYKALWFDRTLRHDRWPRPDIAGGCIGFGDYLTFAPHKEVCRHFDGYTHNPRFPDINEYAYPLEIPPSFFERPLKLRFYYEDYKQEWVNCNGASPLKYNTECGVDHPWLVTDIPLFWHDKIDKIDINIECDIEKIVAANIQWRKRLSLGLL